ncbi:bifunctional [glutamine synthetase] adenylyltransferase/[glutamine synthetase]-adenylyl-L-tyrosine phosphorylase [Geminicoccaceae bacterium 1502E]|nr:bifunctional [glutamine synthetase] adenylyltransferase/[glutamine synthetase]-adenylyl-L-tyrosine phosphorylase [Geminicoccaceae bacterium 1502E]
MPSLLQPPRAADAATAERGLRRLCQVARAHADRPVGDAFAGWLEGELAAGIAAGSPFLTDCLAAEPDVATRFHELGPGPVWEALVAETLAVDRGDRTRLMAGLRRVRRRVALLTALADLSGQWELERVTLALSDFADLAVQRTMQHLLLEGAKRGEIELEEGDDPSAGCGIFILGMGKHGARELNYSSDIDLIVLFDAEAVRYRGAESAMAFCVRLTRSLVHLLENRSRDGYVFRTDLRLRPHPPGHPLALSTDAAELYYERHGQNWERAAFIKARVVAGDRRAGEGFLRVLQPYVWRKHLDYAAIRDIHSIKRQINAYRGFGNIRALGHDLKVGRGGIREIEFFAQTQQLILGGRVPELRHGATQPALKALVANRWLDEETASELIASYRLLRTLEHRLQMVADQQTQALPAREGEFARFAAFAGFPDGDALAETVLATLRTVERHYAALFEAEPDLGGGGSLVFTGTGDDPATLETLKAMGFKDAAGVAGRIRAWHHGHIRATRSTRAREILTELTPSLFEALRRQHDVDTAFKLFDEFVSRLPAGVQLFSLIRANPGLLRLVCDLMGAAPRLARHLAANIDLFEAILEPDFFENLPDAATLRQEYESRLKDARDLQDVLDIARRWAHGRQFQAGLQILLGLSDPEQAAATLTDIAEIVLQSLLPRAEAWLTEQHGSVPGGSFVVLGLGKLGSRELTVGSDLDLVFVYDADPQALSDGAKPLPAHTWYARLGQRLVSALTARTAEGQLFEIDTRLRPSGNVGPVACSVANFARYQEQTAETWEQQALTRARVVAGDAELAAKVGEVIETTLRRPRDLVALRAAVRAMRERIFKGHGSADPWSLKHARGGLVDMEFTAQFLQLAFLHERPELRSTGTADVLASAGEAGLMAPSLARDLVAALRLHHALQAVLRLSLRDRFVPDEAPEGLREALLRAALRANPDGLPLEDFEALEARLGESQDLARRIFDDFCPPAATGGP